MGAFEDPGLTTTGPLRPAKGSGRPARSPGTANRGTGMPAACSAQVVNRWSLARATAAGSATMIRTSWGESGAGRGQERESPR